jgi:hypothetical protein
MNSKEALESIKNTKTNHIKNEKLGQPRKMYLVKELKKEEIKTIKQDLDKLEKLEKAFDKAIEKCMKFDKCPPITCIELANDNDNVCKECWKKYFMKEVLREYENK